MKEDLSKIVQPAVDTFIKLLEGIRKDAELKVKLLDDERNEVADQKKRLKSREDEVQRHLNVRQDEFNGKVFVQQGLNQQLRDEIARYDNLNREIDIKKTEIEAMYDNAKAERDLATEEMKKQKTLTGKHAEKLAMLKLDEDKLDTLRGEINADKKKVDTERRVLEKKEQELIQKEHELVDRELRIRKLEKKVDLIMKQREINA